MALFWVGFEAEGFDKDSILDSLKEGLGYNLQNVELFSVTVDESPDPVSETLFEWYSNKV